MVEIHGKKFPPLKCQLLNPVKQFLLQVAPIFHFLRIKITNMALLQVALFQISILWERKGSKIKRQLFLLYAAVKQPVLFLWPLISKGFIALEEIIKHQKKDLTITAIQKMQELP